MRVSPDLLEALADRVLAAKTPGRFLNDSALKPAIYSMQAAQNSNIGEKGDLLTVNVTEWLAGSRTFKCVVWGITAEDGTSAEVTKEAVVVDTEPLDVRPEQAVHWELLDVEPVRAAWRAATRKLGGQSAEDSKTPSSVKVHQSVVSVRLKDITENAVIVEAKLEDWTVERALVRNMPFGSMQRRMQKWIFSAGLELERIKVRSTNDTLNAKKVRKLKPDVESKLDLRERNGELTKVLCIASSSNAIAKHLAVRVKNYNEDTEEDFYLAASMMAEHVPSGSTLVPAPSSTGKNPAMKILAERVGDLTNSNVVEAVVTIRPRESLRDKRRGRAGSGEETHESLVHETDLSWLCDTMRHTTRVADGCWFVDNQYTAGTTMRAMAAKLGVKALGIAIAKTARARGTGYAKSLDIVGSILLDAIKHGDVDYDYKTGVAACVSASVEPVIGRTKNQSSKR